MRMGLFLLSEPGLKRQSFPELPSLLGLTPATVTCVRPALDSVARANHRAFCCVPADPRVGLGLSVSKESRQPPEARPWDLQRQLSGCPWGPGQGSTQLRSRLRGWGSQCSQQLRPHPSSWQYLQFWGSFGARTFWGSCGENCCGLASAVGDHS